MTTDKIVEGKYKKALLTIRERLGNFLQDEDLDDHKLREASEGLLPNLHDIANAALHDTNTADDEFNKFWAYATNEAAEIGNFLFPDKGTVRDAFDAGLNLNKEQTAQECDATMLNSNSKAD